MRKIGILIIFILAYFSYGATVSMITPVDGAKFDDRYVEFEVGFDGGGEFGGAECTLYVDSEEIQTIQISDSQTNTFSEREYLPGNHRWQVICDSAESEIKEFDISGIPPKVEILSPRPGVETAKRKIEVKMIYTNGTIGSEQVRCNVELDGKLSSEFYLENEKEKTIVAEGFTRGTHRYRIRCDGVNSLYRSIIIKAGRPASVELISPEDGAITSQDEPEISFSYDKGDDAPNSCECEVVSDGYILGREWAKNNEKTKIRANFDGVGVHQYYVQCNANTEFFAKSRNRTIKIEEKKKEVFVKEEKIDNENATNKSKEEVNNIVIDAPKKAKVGRRIEIKLEYSDGRIAKNKTVEIRLKNSTNVIVSRTDERGIAIYTAPVVGEYSYFVDGKKMVGKTVVEGNNLVDEKNESREASNKKEDKYKTLDLLIMIGAGFIIFVVVLSIIWIRVVKD